MPSVMMITGSESTVTTGLTSQFTMPKTAPAGMTIHSWSKRMPSTSQSATTRARALKAQSRRIRFTAASIPRGIGRRGEDRPDGGARSVPRAVPVAAVADERQARVVPAEAEGVGDGRVDVRAARLEHVVEGRLGVGLLQ